MVLYVLNMTPRCRIRLVVVAALLALYGGSAAVMFFALPGPHEQFQCMVIGAGSAGITIFVLFAGLVVRSRL